MGEASVIGGSPIKLVVLQPVNNSPAEETVIELPRDDMEADENWASVSQFPAWLLQVTRI